MTKNGLILTSVVSAIPGAILAAIAVMAFVSYGGGSTVTMKVIAAALCLIGAGLAAMPVGIFLSGPKAEKAAKKKDEKPAEEAAAATAAVAEEAPSADAIADDAGFEADEVIAESDDFAETIEQPASGEEEFEVGSDDDFELDTDEDAPTKKK